MVASSHYNLNLFINMDETDQLINLLSLHERDSSHISAVQKILTSVLTQSIRSHQQSFQLISFLPSLASKLKLRKYSKGKIICTLGTKYTKLYIIIKGVVGVMMPRFPEIITHLHQWDIIGEDLLFELVKSEYIYSALADITLIELSSKLLEGIKVPDCRSKTFLTSQPYFKAINHVSKALLQIIVSEMVAIKEQIIYSESSPTEYVYIIRSGEITQSNSIMFKGKKSIFPIDIINNKDNLRSLSYKTSRQDLKTKTSNQHILKLCEGDIFGAHNSGSGSSLFVCTSAYANLLLIHKAHFDTLTHINKHIMELIEQRQKQHKQLHSNEISRKFVKLSRQSNVDGFAEFDKRKRSMMSLTIVEKRKEETEKLSKQIGKESDLCYSKYNQYLEKQTLPHLKRFRSVSYIKAMRERNFDVISGLGASVNLDSLMPKQIPLKYINPDPSIKLSILKEIHKQAAKLHKLTLS